MQKLSSDFDKAKSFAVKRLVIRHYSQKELELKLLSAGFDDGAIGKAIKELQSLGYINDELYARKFINDRLKLKPKAKRFLKYELMRKGITAEMADTLLDEYKIDEYEMAEMLLQKKFCRFDLDDAKIRIRAYNFLKNRGYDENIIKTLLPDF